MAKRRDKSTSKLPLPSDSEAATVDESHKTEVHVGPSTDGEVECHIAAVEAISNMEVDHMLTSLRLIRSYFTEDQLGIPVLQFFKENLPNVEIVRSNEEGHFDVRWKDCVGNLSTYNTDGRDINSSLFYHMCMAYPSSSTARQSFGGLEFSAKTVKSHLGVDDFQRENYLSQESLNTLMLGMPEGLRTPGATSQRLSVGMTPKTVRLPKHGEMLLSIHGSPLGVYKEETMEAIYELEEDGQS